MRGDSSDVFWIIVLSIALLISIFIARSNSKRANRETANRIKVQEESHRKDADIAKMTALMQGLTRIVDQRKIQFPWLATAIADFHALEAERDAKILEKKKHRAIRAASEVREHGRKRREAERSFRLMRYRVEYYEKLFPWIAEYVGDDVPDDAVDLSGALAEPTDDPVKRWVNDTEYQKLSTAGKNQLALDRWRTSRKSNWEVGHDYERFIGHSYETLGYDVLFTGAIQGLEDIGARCDRAEGY